MDLPHFKMVSGNTHLPGVVQSVGRHDFRPARHLVSPDSLVSGCGRGDCDPDRKVGFETAPPRKRDQTGAALSDECTDRRFGDRRILIG